MASIIKAGQQGADSGAVNSVVFNFDDVSARAANLLAQVRRQAEEILQQAHKDADEIRQQAQAEGRKLALEIAADTAREQVDQRMKDLRPALLGIVSEIDDHREHWFQQWEANAIRFAVRIASRVLKREVDVNPQVSPELIREALELISHTTSVEIRLHPADHALLNESLEDMTSPIADIAEIRIVPDAAVSRSGCRVVTDHGEVDQQLETRLDRIESELLPQ